MYTRQQICTYFGFSRRTFERYRAYGIVGPPTPAGCRRYCAYDDDDVRRIRQARRRCLDDPVRISQYGEFDPHPRAAMGGQ